MVWNDANGGEVLSSGGDRIWLWIVSRVRASMTISRRPVQPQCNGCLKWYRFERFPAFIKPRVKHIHNRSYTKLCQMQPRHRWRVDLFPRSTSQGIINHVSFISTTALSGRWNWSPPQIKELLKLKDKNGTSLLAFAAVSKNPAMFNAVMTFVEHHLSSQEVKWKSKVDVWWPVRVRADERHTRSRSRDLDLDCSWKCCVPFWKRRSSL